MFVAAVGLLYAAFSASWWSFGEGDMHGSVGLIRGEFCGRGGGDCETFNIFQHVRVNADFLITIFQLIFILAVIGLAIPTGIMLLKPGRRILSIFVVSAAGGAALMDIIGLAKNGAHGASPSIGFIAFWLCSICAITGSILAMVRPRGPQQQHPGYPMQPQMPGGYPQQQGYAPQQPMQQQPYAQQSQPMQPMQQQPYSAQQSQPMQPMQPQQAPVGQPCPTCQTPVQWVAQYQRWFCQRCQRYV
jgi:hypothetical protein